MHREESRVKAEAAVLLIKQLSLLPAPPAAAAGFVAEDAADTALQLQRSMAVPESPKAGSCHAQWDVRGEAKDIRRRGRKQPSETVSNKQQFISFFYYQGFLGLRRRRRDGFFGGWGES